MREQKLEPLQRKSTDDRKFHDPIDSKADELWRSRIARLSEPKLVIIEKGRRNIKLGKQEKKRLGRRKAIEKRAEKSEDIKVYGESQED